MADVSIRDLRNHGGDIVDRVAAGEHVTITRGGVPVAELRRLTRQWLDTQGLLRRWARLPVVDPDAWRADVDRIVDAGL